MELQLERFDATPERTIGRFAIGGRFLGYSLEDALRSGQKVPGRTAIPAGHYRVVLSWSNRFRKVMPEVLAVPGFAGVRIHGGNTAADTEGCPLIGARRRGPNAIAECAPVLATLHKAMEHAAHDGAAVWLTITDPTP